MEINKNFVHQVGDQPRSPLDGNCHIHAYSRNATQVGPRESLETMVKSNISGLARP